MSTTQPRPSPPTSRGRERGRAGQALLAAAALAVGACGSDDDANDAGGAIDGKALYAANCATCHGADLRGTDRGPSHLSQVYEESHHNDDSFRAAITRGARAHHWRFGDMPAVPGLSDPEIDAIIAYVREQQQREGFEPYPPA